MLGVPVAQHEVQVVAAGGAVVLRPVEKVALEELARDRSQSVRVEGGQLLPRLPIAPQPADAAIAGDATRASVDRILPVRAGEPARDGQRDLHLIARVGPGRTAATPCRQGGPEPERHREACFRDHIAPPF